jgi:hypothetical protein
MANENADERVIPAPCNARPAASNCLLSESAGIWAKDAFRAVPTVRRPLKRTLQSLHQAKSEEEAMTEPGPILKNQPDQRAKAGPGLGLTHRQNKAVRFLGKHHPEPQPTSVIPGVSDITMEELIDRNVVAEVRDPHGKERVFVLMASGEDEARRLILQDESHRKANGRSLRNSR